MTAPASAFAAADAAGAPTPVRQVPWPRLVGWFGFGVALVICAYLLYSDLHDVMGRRAFFYALGFGFAPVVPLVAVFWWIDRLRPEPRGFLIAALLWGGCIATLVALRLNSWLVEQLGGGTGSGVGAVAAIYVAPWVEETSKAAVIFAIVWWRRHDFNSVIAGVVYGGLAGVGFAFTENIVYYGQVFQGVLTSRGDNSLALDAVQELFWWRGVAAPFVHPMFTMMTGLGVGLAVRHRHVGVRILSPVAGFCAAALLHMGYNTIATFAADDALTAVYIGILLPTLAVLGVMIALVRRHERKVVAARLHDYSAYGWLKADQIRFIVQRRGRRQARRYAKPFGKVEQQKVKAFQRTGMHLGVLRDRLVRGVVDEKELDRERDLIAQMRAYRGTVMLPGTADVGVEGASATGSSW